MADDAARYFRVSPRFWATMTHLSDDAKLLAFYLLTCPHRTVEGLFRLPKRYVEADLEWSPQRLAKPFAELLDDGFLEYDDNRQVALITKALKYQAPANGNVVTAALRQLELVPESPLDARFHEVAQRFSQRLAERLPERFTKPPTPTPTPTPTPKPTVAASGDRALELAGPPFDDFADTYPRHPDSNKLYGGASRAATRKAWDKLTAAEQHAAAAGARHYAAWTARPNADRPKHATTWLNQRCWDDWQEPAAPSRQQLRDMPRNVREAVAYDEALDQFARQDQP